MNINFEEYAGPCACGKNHEIVTKAAVIEEGCLKNIERYMEEYGVRGKRLALYDANTYAATSDRHPKAEQMLILNPEGLHADEKSTAEVLEKMEPDIEVILAVGSGTICDIARFCAHEKGIRFVACVTGASVDGFCSNVAAMTWHGYKKTMPAVAPELVIADLNVISKAPEKLVKSGVGDIFAKYIALADWRISHLLTGEYFCSRICELTEDAVDAVSKGAEVLAAAGIGGSACVSAPEGKKEGASMSAASNEISEKTLNAYADVIYALLMSGIAMQMMGNSRPASGAEHHISHMVEMEASSLKVQFYALHGEKTGVGTLVALEEYKRLADISDITSLLMDYAPVSEEIIEKYYGPKIKEAITEENKEDCLAPLSKDTLCRRWNEVRAIVKDIPEPSEIFSKLEKLDAKRTLESIGVSEDKRSVLLDYSPLVRNRLTLMRIRRMLKKGKN